MTYEPPPYAGPSGNASWTPISQPHGWPASQPPTVMASGPRPRRRRGGLVIAALLLTLGLVAASCLWLVALSRNNDLLADNEQLIAKVTELHATQESLQSRNSALRAEMDDSERIISTCVDALDAAEATVDVLGDVLDLSADAIEAASTWNAARLDSVNRDLDALQPQVERAVSDYRTAASGCRAGS